MPASRPSRPTRSRPTAITPYIADIGLRAALYKLMGKDIPGQKSYQHGQELVLPDSPTVVADNAEQWIGRGGGDFEPTPDPCKK